MTPQRQDSVTELLRRARAEDPDALGQLLEIYRSYLGLLAQLQIDRRLQGKASASDMVQEAFLQAKRGFSEFRGQTEQELIAWLRRILAARLASVVRHYTTQRRNIDLERQMEAHLQHSSMDLAAQIPSRIETPSEMASQREAVSQLADALQRLRPEYREVIVLRHLEGRPFAEVAQHMHRTLDSVKSLWMRAFRQLQKELQ